MCRPQPLHACTVAALFAITASLASGAAPAVNPELLNRAWTARWIAPAKAPPFEYGVYHFRKSFDLPAKPEHFVVHVTGDNRYQLFVNGERVLAGPARGDLFHWRFETRTSPLTFTAARTFSLRWCGISASTHPRLR